MTPEMWAVIGLTITGICSFGGVVYASNKSHNSQDQKQDATIDMIRAENKAATDLIKLEFKDSIESVKRDIKRLEVKQDKHNGLMEKVYKAEAHIETLNCKVESLEKRKSA